MDSRTTDDVSLRVVIYSDQCVAIQRAMTPERRAAAEDARVGADCPRARGGPPVSDAIDSTHANTRFTTSEV